MFYFFIKGENIMKKIYIIHGELEKPLQKKAVEVLSKLLLDYSFEYPACFHYSKTVDCEDAIHIYIGTKKNNPIIKQLSVASLSYEEEYCIKVKDSSVYIEGFDDSGVLYGCIDFYNKYLLKLEYPHDAWRFAVNPFDKPLPDFELISRPSVKNRGIWTWGHVIYDYRGFIDNMVMLKMNCITIWNDFAPVNAREIINYAHDCGIKVYWGYSWGWENGCKHTTLEDLLNTSDDIIEKFENEYATLDVDGIYFQSCTELNTEKIGDKIIAEAVCELVNKTALKLFDKYPDLELQFGLHATSVKNRLDVIRNVDKRIRIVWEDCGSFPFSCIPKDVEDFEKTKDFVNRIANLRGDDDKFGVVTKGIVKLNWFAFEHLKGAAFVGTSSKFMKHNRVVRKNKIWKYIQAYWIAYAPKAHEMVKTLSEIKNGDLYITPLVEDGMFEENIMYPIALFSEMMWDCNSDVSEMMSDVALRGYVDFA